MQAAELLSISEWRAAASTQPPLRPPQPRGSTAEVSLRLRGTCSLTVGVRQTGRSEVAGGRPRGGSAPSCGKKRGHLGLT